MTTAQAAALAKRDAEPLCQLYAAVATVMARVERLKKADNNAFAKYKFTSVDDFKDHIRPLLAANGLSIRTDEVAFDTSEFVADNGKKSLIAKYRFAFALAHVSGAVEPAEHSTVSLPYTGAQTTGAARSYAIKEWLKSKFLASSGDPDPAEEADTHEQRGYSATKPKRLARADYEAMQKELRACKTMAQLAAWSTANQSKAALLPDDWHALLQQDYRDKAHELKANGNGAPKLAALPEEMEPNKALRNNLADSAFGDGYSSQIEEWRARLNLASRAEQAELFDTEIDPRNEAGGIFPKDYTSLLGLIKNA